MPTFRIFDLDDSVGFGVKMGVWEGLTRATVIGEEDFGPDLEM
jgi:hypothetical protein